MAKYENRASDNAQVVAQISVAHDRIYMVGGDLNQGTSNADRQYLLDQITELGREIDAAQARGHIPAQSSAVARAELAEASAQVDAAVSGDSSGLLASLRKLREPLAGALDLLAKVAAVISAVQGLR